jgi:hypothetical protein
MKFTFTNEDAEDDFALLIQFEAVTLSEIDGYYRQFLRGAGYVVNDDDDDDWGQDPEPTPLAQIMDEQEQERIESLNHQFQLAKKPREANDVQEGGTHYKDNAIQPWDYIESNRLSYLEGNVVKYVSRWRVKGGIEDLRKAQHYLQKLIEVTEKTK